MHRNSGKTMRNNQTGEHLFSDCLRLLAVFLRRWSTVIGYELGLIRLIALPPAFPCQPPRPAFYRGSKIFPHLRTSITYTIVVSLKFDSKRTYGPQCTGRHFRTKLMSQYIGSDQKKKFDVRIQELVSKVQKNGGFLRKKRFSGSIFGFFSCSVVIFGPIFMKFWLHG